MKRTTTLLALLLTTGLATASAFAGPNGSKPSNHNHKQKILQKYDTNKDGTLDAKEKAALEADRAQHRQANGAKRAQRRAAMIARFDTNGNGQIEPAEKQAAITQRSNTRFDRMLVKLDTNGDKMLSAAEFAAKKKAAKPGKTGKWTGKARKPGMAKARFARVDLDNNGQITRAEFRKAALTKGTMRHGKRGKRGMHQGKRHGKAAPTK